MLWMITFLATACGATPTPVLGIQSTQAAQTAAAKPIEVTWLVRSDNAEQAWENKVVILGFAAHNPHIKINLVVVSASDFDSRLQAMLAAGTPPDIWSQWGGSGFVDYVKSGLVADLTPYIEKDNVDLSDFVPDLLNIYTVDGEQMGLPFAVASAGLFYNKDLFNKFGVTYPPTSWDDTSWTYAQFLDMCKAMTKVTGDPLTDVYGCNMGFSLDDSYAWMYGKNIYPDNAYLTGFADTAFLDDPLIMQAFQDRQDIVWKYHYMPDPATAEAFGGEDLFKMQKVAVQVSDSEGWEQYSGIKDFNWAVGALPYGAPGRFSPTFTDPWMMSSKSAHPQQAWEFLKYLISPDVQQSWSKATFSPPVRQSLLEDWFKSFSTMSSAEVKDVFEGSLKYGKESPSHLLVHFDQLNLVVSQAIDPILDQKVTAMGTLPAANRKLIETLQEIRSENQK